MPRNECLMYYLFFPQLVSSILLHYLLKIERKDYMRMRKACSFSPKKNYISLWLSTSVDSSLVNPDWDKVNRSNLKLIQNVKETNNKRNKAKSLFAKKIHQKNLHH